MHFEKSTHPLCEVHLCTFESAPVHSAESTHGLFRVHPWTFSSGWVHLKIAIIGSWSGIAGSQTLHIVLFTRKCIRACFAPECSDMWLMVRSKSGETFSCVEKTFVSALTAFVSADRGRRLETTLGERTGRKASACQAPSAKPNAARRPCRRFSCEKETSPSKTPASPLIKPGKRPMKSPLPPYVFPKPLICFLAGAAAAIALQAAI